MLLLCYCNVVIVSDFPSAAPGQVNTTKHNKTENYAKHKMMYNVLLGDFDYVQVKSDHTIYCT